MDAYNDDLDDVAEVEAVEFSQCGVEHSALDTSERTARHMGRHLTGSLGSFVAVVNTEPCNA